MLASPHGRLLPTCLRSGILIGFLFEYNALSGGILVAKVGFEPTTYAL